MIETGTITIIALRLLVPLLILRFPLAGGVLAVLLDIVKNYILDFLGGNSFFFQHYHTLDKALDTYYLSLEFLVVLRWNDLLAKNTAIILFVVRIAGVFLFYATQLRVLFIIFPNLFENFYLFYLFAKKYLPAAVPRSKKQMFSLLFILLIPKFFQEFLVHNQYIGWRAFWRGLTGG